MGQVAVFHRIGEPTPDKFTHSLEQILGFDGVITFDGAYDSIYAHRFELAPKAPIMFVQADTVDTEGVMSWDELEELYHLGFVAGWHGRTHRKLTELPDHVVIRELTPVHPDVKLYAYPHGDWDERVAQIVKGMGYLRAYSTTQGEEGNDYAIPRIYL